MEIWRSYDRLISTMGFSNTGKMTSLYWIRAQDITSHWIVPLIKPQSHPQWSCKLHHQPHESRHYSVFDPLPLRCHHGHPTKPEVTAATGYANGMCAHASRPCHHRSPPEKDLKAKEWIIHHALLKGTGRGWCHMNTRLKSVGVNR